MSPPANAALEVWYWSPITDNDQTGLGWIVGGTLFSFVLISTCARLFLNRRAPASADYLIATSLVFVIAQSGTLFAALDHGLGKNAPLVTDPEEVFKTTFASDVLTLTAHYLAKASMAVLIHRLFRGVHPNSLYCTGLVGVVVGAAVVSLLLLLAHSGKVAQSTIHTSVSSLNRSWEAVFAFDCVTEIALAAVPLFLIVTILKKSKSNFVVWLVFLSRLPTIAFAILHLTRRISITQTPTNVGPQLLYCEMTLEAELAWSVVAASIPGLKSIMQPFHLATDVPGRPNGEKKSHHEYSSAPGSARKWPIFFYS